MDRTLFSLVKKEMQGNKGLIKQVRNRFIPTTVEMAQLAQKTFEKKINDFSNIDTALNSLLVIEYDIYLFKQNQINEQFIYFADEIATSKTYPNIRKVIDDYKKRYNNREEATQILNGISKIITALADSNRQSRVSRAGASLMEHIAYLLKKRGFEYQTHFQREYVLGKGCKVDFFFPDAEHYKKEPKDCVAVSCQTTSNDRFRLTFAQIPVSTRNRACTAIGCTNFGKNLGPASLTDGKLREAKEQGIRFVILEKGVDERLEKSNAVMTYSEWFDELEKLKIFWN